MTARLSIVESTPPLLDVHGLSVSYGGVKAVADVTFRAPLGSIT